MMRAASRPRLVPALIGGLGLLLAVKVGGIAHGMLGGAPRASSVGAAAPSGSRLDLVATAHAQQQPPRPAAPLATVPAGPASPQPEQGCDLPRTERAERALLEQLRGRRGELERREQAVVERETLLAAAERRLGERVDALSALQARIEAAEQARGEREEQGWRQMVKLYEGMRPREAATIFEELEMSVLLQILSRMGERKAAPILGAMRPERARQVTAGLARQRAPSPTY